MNFPLTEIFCLCDDFHKIFSKELDAQSIGDGFSKHLQVKLRMSMPEIMTIVICFPTQCALSLAHNDYSNRCLLAKPSNSRY